MLKIILFLIRLFVIQSVNCAIPHAIPHDTSRDTSRDTVRDTARDTARDTTRKEETSAKPQVLNASSDSGPDNQGNNNNNKNNYYLLEKKKCIDSFSYYLDRENRRVTNESNQIENKKRMCHVYPVF